MNIRQEAYHTVVKILKDKEYSDTLLHQKAKRIKESQENLALFYNLTKGIVKMHLKLDYIIQQFTDPRRYQSTDLKTRCLLYLGLYQIIFMNSIPEHAAVHETVQLAKTLMSPATADFVNAILRSYLREPAVNYPENIALRIAYEHSYPPELIRQWIDLWGAEETEYLALFFNENPELHLRVNTTATSQAKLIHYFSKRDVRLEPSSASPNLLTTKQGEEALDAVAFSEGYFSVQDTSAALIVELLSPQPEENILDLFAAPGGKCTYIAELMNNTGEVVAVDKIPNKMKLLKQAADRLQLTNIKQVVADSFTYGPVAPAYDRVLVDAPCSGWGVFGRKSDLRWQVHQNLPELLKLQEKALIHAANFVKPGGVLVYSTCTMNPAENELQVQKFLKQNGRYSLVNAAEYIPERFTAAGFLVTMPYKHNMDGAFAAKMVRSS
ncbi:MAG: 16S rRNA (cytosine(967)-C(5))-methyltransferase RsmB [Candidatus Cloacimonetes bacterium]|nr:16S rRNA (cytosine(967)-C(5))-methyltransferase RsmB [Candidatus Cloacimonadota bacterium]